MQKVTFGTLVCDRVDSPTVAIGFGQDGAVGGLLFRDGELQTDEDYGDAVKAVFNKLQCNRVAFLKADKVFQAIDDDSATF